MRLPTDIFLLLVIVIGVVLILVIREWQKVSSKTAAYKSTIRTPEDAEAVYTETLRRFPNRWQASFNRATIRCQHGDYDGTLADVNHALSLQPRFAPAYKLRGDVHSARQEFEQAEADYQQVLSLRSKPEQKAAASTRLGMLKMNAYNRLKPTDEAARSRLMEQALADFEAALRFDPNNALAWSCKAQTFKRKGDVQAAFTIYDEAFRHTPYSPILLTDRGTLYTSQGDFDAAIADYDKSIYLSPNYALAYNNRGYAHALRGDLKQALADCNRVLELIPRFYYGYGSRAYTYFLMGNFEAALADFQAALDIKPDHDYALAGKAIILYHLDRTDEAKATWRALLELDPEYADPARLKRDYSCPDSFVEEARKVIALLDE